MTDTSDSALLSAPTPADLTICLCTIGRDGFLQAALQTLLDTTPAGVTLRILLNGPDDPALVQSIEQFVREWDGPRSITVIEERRTISGSHNAALDATTTDFVTFMGDDDLVLEPRVQRMLSLFATITPTPAVIGSYCRRVSGTATEPRFSTNKDYGPTTIAEWEDVRDSNELIEIVFPSAIYRTELLKEMGGFEERFGSAMDLATFTTLGAKHPVLADPRRTFAHRIHDGSVTSSSAAQHAGRLRYTQRCMAAMKNGQPQPSWESFLEAESADSSLHRLTDQRRVLSATMFRQGGAAIASGARVGGVMKVVASALLSPGAFLGRSRSQLRREPAGLPVVSLLLKNINHYRVPFYERLRDELRVRDIELRLVVADGLAEDLAKGDSTTINWAEHRPFRELSIGGKTLLWQPGFDVASGSDLMITEQASKQLFNIVLGYGQRMLRTRHAFWGHGKNFQASIEGASGESLKNRLTKRAHWFFAYNDLSADAAIAAGMPRERVTPVMNTTDTEHIKSVLDALPAETDRAVREELGIGSGPVVIYMGGVYPPKRPQYVIEAAHGLRALVPDVELLTIGGGSLESVFASAAADHSWIHAVGPRYGDDRIRLASIASLQLMPGMVGLNIVDAFALGLPTITTDIDYHSPEIDYLANGVNGVICEGDPAPTRYAEIVAEVLTDPERLLMLQRGARRTGDALTISQMATLFADGVVAALAAAPR